MAGCNSGPLRMLPFSSFHWLPSKGALLAVEVPGRERLFEPPGEKVRIKIETQGEKEGEIIKSMIGGMPPGMGAPSIPTIVILTPE